MHVHDEDVRALREQVDPNGVLKPAGAELVQLDAVAAADAQDARIALGVAAGDRLVDQDAKADPGVVRPLPQRATKLDVEIAAVLRRLHCAEAAEADAMTDVRETPHGGTHPRAHAETWHLHAEGG